MGGPIHTLTRTQVLPGSLIDVFAFFERPENLARITPPWLGFSMVIGPPVEMRRGAVIDYTIRWVGIPLRWRTLITEYEPPTTFIDEQLRGPFAIWEHTHQFRSVVSGVEMRDTVRYKLPLGLVGRAAHALVVGRQLEEIFDYRARVITTILAAGDKERK